MSHPKVIKLDSRRRVSFAKVGRPEHARYAVVEHPNGQIELIPTTNKETP